MRGAATINSVFLWNSPYTLTHTSYFDFSNPIYFQPSLVPALLANYPNGTLGRDANGKLMFKQNDAWRNVVTSKNTTSTSDETTAPTFPANPADGDYHEHTYTGEEPNETYLYIYKFGRWILIGSHTN